MMNLDRIFKAYDIRGLVPQELNEQVAEAVGAAFAEYLSETIPATSALPLVIGYDMRPDSRALSTALIAGITSGGRRVIDIGQITTDMLYFGVGHLGAAAGAMVTASHNPGAYNGMKLCREAARPIGVESGLRDIKKLTQQQLTLNSARDLRDSSQPTADHNDKKGRITSENILAAWIDHVLSFVDVAGLKPYRLAVDAGNGMAGAIIPALAERTPFKITPLYFELDGTFPNHEANPLKSENLADLRQAVIRDELDLGLAFDGDGDRAFLIDEAGQTVSGSVLTAILAAHFLKINPGATILHNVICSRVVPETIKNLGGQPVRTRVGHSYIKAAMREHDAPFGGEHSGHYYFRDNWCADSGLIAALIAIGTLSESGGTLAELAERYRIYHESGEINFEVVDKPAMLAKLAREFSDGEQDRLDGLTVNYPDWWFNVRPSNTEPLLRLNVEAKTQPRVDEMIGTISQIIQAT